MKQHSDKGVIIFKIISEKIFAPQPEANAGCGSSSNEDDLAGEDNTRPFSLTTGLRNFSPGESRWPEERSFASSARMCVCVLWDFPSKVRGSPGVCVCVGTRDLLNGEIPSSLPRSR